MYFKISILCFISLLNINTINTITSDDLCNLKIRFKNSENGDRNYFVLVNAKKQLLFDNLEVSEQGLIEIDLPKSVIFSHEGNHTISVYSTDSGLSLVHLQDSYLTSEDRDKCDKHVSHNIREKRFSPTGHSIGLQYSVWHVLGAYAQHKTVKNGGKPTTMERIIESGGSIHDYYTHNVTEADSGNMIYQSESRWGFYCEYRKRPHETKPAAPECADIDKTYARHAEMMVSSGIDYVYVDLTNLCDYSNQEDALQRRPFELLFEEWHKLRTQNKQTPQVVAWHKIDLSACVTWKDYLKLYNQYPDLVWKDPKTGKMVFMATAASDSNIKKQIESNGGKNNVVVVNNWVATPEEAKTGRWQFMGRCGAQQNKESSDIAGRNTCDQAVTRNSPIGDQISVGVSNQLNYASAAWGATGSYYGLTFLLQWDTALRENPEHITISGWNEFGAGAWPNPWSGSWSKSMGLNPNDNRLFVDLYGAYRSRDIEPTLEYGDLFYNIMKSCIRVRNLNLHNNRHDCSVANEECCKLNGYKQYVEIHSMLKKDNTDYILVNSLKERDSLLTTYNEICVYNSASKDYCTGGDAKDFNSGLSGPFVLFDRDGPNRKPLNRCKIGQNHFFSVDDKCEGQIKEYTLGYLSTKRDSMFVRSLIRCITASGVHYHSLDGPCHPNDKAEAPLGFVV